MSLVTINNAANGDEWAEFTIDHDLNDNVTLRIINHGNVGTFDVDWGDGNIDAGLATGTNATHTYVGPATTLRVRSSQGLEGIKEFGAFDSSNPIHFTGNVNQTKQFTALELLLVSTYESAYLFTGETTDLPDGLTTLVLNSNVNINFVTLATKCPNLEHISVQHSVTGTVSGGLGDLPDSVSYFLVGNTIPNTNVNVSGTVANIPRNITYFNLNRNSLSISGNIANLPPNISYFQVSSNNNITGDIQNIPATCNYFNLTGNNTVFGDIGNLQSSTIQLIIHGDNNIEGDIVNVTNTIGFNIMGNNTLSGSIHTITINDQYLGFTNTSVSNTIENSGSKDYSSVNSASIFLYASASMLPSHVDQLINDLDAISTKSSIYLNLSGPGAVRTSASDAAYTSITSGGGTIILNP